MINYAGKKILLGGDATKFAWKNILEFYGNSLEADIFLAPGHGSKNHISSEIHKTGDGSLFYIWNSSDRIDAKASTLIGFEGVIISILFSTAGSTHTCKLCRKPAYF